MSMRRNRFTGFWSAMGAIGGICGIGAAALLTGLLIPGCISDYKDSYKLRKVEAYIPTPVENTAETCADHADNDANGLVDCDDPACGFLSACQTVNNADNAENTLVRCSDGIDNDNNGQVDCADARCQAFQKCQAPVLAENTPALCGDKIDNDNNGKVDCADAQCQPLKICEPAPASLENTTVLCADRIDNDANGKIDCEDPACQTLKMCGAPVLVENTLSLCTDKIDNDANGKIDCADTTGCGSFTMCQRPVENTPALCTDSKDNDGDGLTDCKDSDCENFLVCHPAENTTLLCKDGLDNDSDGLIDCKDPNCKDLFTCSVPDQDTVLILGYKTKGKLTPSIDATKPPWNLTWYFNGGDVGAVADPGVKGILAGRSEEVTTCNLEPKCRKLTFTATWGIGFLLFINNAGLQDTVNLSSWIGSALKFSIQSQVPDLRIKIESKHLADAVEIRLIDVGYDATKTGWQNIVVPLLIWTSSQKLEFNRLPFSLTKPEGAAGGTVLLENLRFEKEGVQ
ncbi:MAG: Tryptophan synthase alpha chain [Fibrobacteres bacterium]|nr:Tryptophan synthase alpha chain [Fibrobacterota bacterium]